MMVSVLDILITDNQQDIYVAMKVRKKIEVAIKGG